MDLNVLTADDVFVDFLSFKEYLNDSGFGDSVVFEEPYYFDAIIGVTDNGNVVYNYDLMAASLVASGDCDTIVEAMEFIDYNTARTIPYINKGVKPIIVYGF